MESSDPLNVVDTITTSVARAEDRPRLGGVHRSVSARRRSCGAGAPGPSRRPRGRPGGGHARGPHLLPRRHRAAPRPGAPRSPRGHSGAARRRPAGVAIAHRFRARGGAQAPPPRPTATHCLPRRVKRRRKPSGRYDDWWTISDAPPFLPAAVEVAAFRIASEAMTNTARHSGASRCTVEIVRAIRAAAAGEAIFGTDRGPGDQPLRERLGLDRLGVPHPDRPGARGGSQRESGRTASALREIVMT